MEIQGGWNSDTSEPCRRCLVKVKTCRWGGVGRSKGKRLRRGEDEFGLLLIRNCVVCAVKAEGCNVTR